MESFTTGPDYWDRKFTAYMHDPFDKVFHIPGHEERAKKIFEIYGFDHPNQKFWKRADAIASGFERGQVPSYNSDERKNGAINFLDNPILTHPITGEVGLKIDLQIALKGGNHKETAEKINSQVIKYLKEKIGMQPGDGGYSDRFAGDNATFAIARFLYTHLALRFKLAEDNVADLGALWHRLPADSRFPDHSIWQHNGLTSALYSCMELAENESGIGLMVFSITPVQPFISTARKLRDYWSGSVLLSWLAFEGIKWVMENLGPDHLLYPSLIDQPLVNEYLNKMWKIDDIKFWDNQKREIATLPNKFLFLAPINRVEEIAGQIEENIKTAWKRISQNTVAMIEKFLPSLPQEEKQNLNQLFSRQNSNYWNLQWSAASLVSKDNTKEIEKLLSPTQYQNNFEMLDIFNRILVDPQYNHYDKSGTGLLYSISHSLTQSSLACIKTRREITRLPENGEKCHQCAEFEVVHPMKYQNDFSTLQYKEKINSFWQSLKETWHNKHDFNPHEKLCSICLTKRIAYRVIEKSGNDEKLGPPHQILSATFKDKEGFPSTTEVSLYNYFKRKMITNVREKREIANQIHESSEEKGGKGIANRDRYYAILMMDGDKMGKLVNGETIDSTWESVMHPDIVRRLKERDFADNFRINWGKIFTKKEKRLLTPSVHAAISESLGDFVIYGVAPIIDKFEGKLIYAGGDDVCAVLPIDNVVKAAREIKDYYNSSFKLIQDNQRVNKDVGGDWTVERGKLSINLGAAKDISISGAILICHHKESLKEMILRAHYLLDEKAKREGGRNCLAIELRKRSGGARYFRRKWSDRTWDDFEFIGEHIGNSEKAQVSTSLVYRLENFRSGIEAILEHDGYRHLLEKFILKQLDRSAIGDNANQEIFAQMMAKIVVERDVDDSNKNSRNKYCPEGLIIASFLAKQGGQND